MAEYGACLVGLGNRFLYTTGARMLEESLTLDNRPSGYDALCRAVMAGTLSDPAACAALCEDFWSGVCEWARPFNLHLIESLDALLEKLARDPSA
jgi:kanamycin nucleotidyltransferase